MTKANPASATTGAARARAKAALGYAIDRRLAFDIEAMELAMLSAVIGCEPEGPGGVRERLDAATLGELEAWTKAVTEGRRA